MLGTASTTQRWLLVEEPGPWGSGPVPTSRLGDATTASLRATAAATSARLLLVRRPAGHHRSSPPDRTLFRVTCTRGSAQVQLRRCAPHEVAAAAADGAGWARSDDRLLLVCTHGRKDWCCAVRGRPVALALSAVEPDATWECSHLGGDRFAATVLALPSGCTYGRVAASDVEGLAAAVRAGRVPARLLRGRCTDAPAVQAADACARSVLGREDEDDLRPVTARRGPDRGTWRVVLAGSAGSADRAGSAGRPGFDTVEVVVREGRTPSAERLTCGAATEQHAPTWELLDLTVAAAPARTG